MHTAEQLQIDREIERRQNHEEFVRRKPEYRDTAQSELDDELNAADLATLNRTHVEAPATAEREVHPLFANILAAHALVPHVADTLARQEAKQERRKFAAEPVALTGFGALVE
jgi:hypothetical protein